MLRFARLLALSGIAYALWRLAVTGDWWNYIPLAFIFGLQFVLTWPNRWMP